MDLNAYREEIIRHIDAINQGLRDNEPKLTVRDFTDEELVRFIEKELTERERIVVKLRFSDSAPSFRKIASQLGLSHSRPKQLIESSINRFIKMESGFRVS